MTDKKKSEQARKVREEAVAQALEVRNEKIAQAWKVFEGITLTK